MWFTMSFKCLKCKQGLSSSDTIKYGLHIDCFVSWFKTSASAEFISLTQRASSNSDPDSLENYSINNTSFFHGKFKKYSAELESESYIIKMREESEAPELPEVEYVCNQIAQSMGIPVPEYYYIDFYTQKVFVTKVFIKRASGSINLEHIYKFRSDTDHSCEQLLNVIKATTQRPYDVEVFLNTLLFDALIGNHDRHGRNLAFLVTPSKTDLSPIYDNVSYLSLVSGDFLRADFNPTGRIATAATKEPSMKDYVLELKRLEYGDLVKQFIQKVKINKIQNLINESYCSDLMKEALKKLIQKRYQELISGI